MSLLWFVGWLWLFLISRCLGAIERDDVLRQFYPQRTSLKHETPLQVGNGNFAFNADITGLQTIRPFNILSGWGWHSSPRREPLAPSSKVKRKDNRVFEVFDCAYLHRGRLRPEYETWNATVEDDQQPLGWDRPPISQDDWESQNPHRINLGRIGLLWDGREILDWEIQAPNQTLNLSSGILNSMFSIYDVPIEVESVASPTMDTVAFDIRSGAFINGSLSIFLDFPYPKENFKFESPYMGDYSNPSRHQTTFEQWGQRVQITHQLDKTIYYANLQWLTERSMPNFTRVALNSHRYVLNLTDVISAQMSVRFSSHPDAMAASFDEIKSESNMWWSQYWNTGGFVDCTSTKDKRARELQRRIILSQYLMAVNAAGIDPPQESGLVNNGWSGKFQMDMAWWNLAHWERWSKWERIGSAIPLVYERFLQSSIQRAKQQGLKGARWGKLLDPSGKSSPGELNAEPIWQQPHPFYFAELEYNAFPTTRTLKKWHRVLEETAEFMASFARYNSTTKFYDLGPGLHTVSGDTEPKVTSNPTFELAYWRYGLHVAQKWYQRQNFKVPEHITKVYENLAPFPIANGSYIAYEGAQDMRHNTRLISNHASLAGIFGMLPPDPRLNLTIFQNTIANIYQTFFTGLSSPAPFTQPSPLSASSQASITPYGWNFPLLAMTAVRMGDSDRAINWLLHPAFEFDDAGMPSGLGKAPTPYFPSSGGLLMAVAMLADGWRELAGRKWPRDWVCESEAFVLGI
jgi:hypothetical protein